jgi:hypothetical protein
MDGWKIALGAVGLAAAGFLLGRREERAEERARAMAPMPSPVGLTPPASGLPAGYGRVADLPWAAWQSDGLQHLTTWGQQGALPILQQLRVSAAPTPQTNASYPSGVSEYTLGDALDPVVASGPAAVALLAQSAASGSLVLLPADTLEGWRTSGRPSGQGTRDRVYVVGRSVLTPDFLDSHPGMSSSLVVLSE